MIRIRSYGSIVLSPGAGARASEPSSGAQLTSDRTIGSRRLTTSDSRPSICIVPTSRHSSVIPSNWIPRSCAPAEESPDALAWPASFLRLRKSNGTLLLRCARLLADRLDDRRIGEGRGVPEIATLGDVAQQAPHDLARARLRQVRHEHEELRARDRPDDVRDVLAQLDRQRVGRLLAGLEDDEGEDRLAGDLILLA